MVTVYWRHGNSLLLIVHNVMLTYSSHSIASNILLDAMLQQRHQRALEELEQEMKAEMQRARDQMNEDLNAELLSALTVCPIVSSNQ